MPNESVVSLRTPLVIAEPIQFEKVEDFCQDYECIKCGSFDPYLKIGDEPPYNMLRVICHRCGYETRTKPNDIREWEALAAALYETVPNYGKPSLENLREMYTELLQAKSETQRVDNFVKRLD